MRIVVDRDRCQGHARCQAEGPDVYELDDMGYNSTSSDHVPTELQNQARRGALACPEYAITVIDDLGSDEHHALT
jgi:ferredoxin